MTRKTRLHGGRDSQRGMNAAEVVVSEVQRARGFQVRQLLAERVRQPCESAIALESKRVLRPSGLAYHVIGTFDHYANVDKRIRRVNFLQYPEWEWKFFVKNKISYHNRLRAKEFLQIFRSRAADIRVVRDTIEPSDLAALKTLKLDPRFAGMTEEELAVSGSEVLYSVP